MPRFAIARPHEMAQSDSDKARLRIARFLSRGEARPSHSSGGRKVLLDGLERGTISVCGQALKAMASDGLVEKRAGKLSLSSAGVAYLGRALAGGDPFQDQHRDLEEICIETPEGPATATANFAESPLAQLARRKAKDGRPFLTEHEWSAGERLRSDYTRGQLMPRMGANWVASVASGRRDGGNSIADLTDAALASRQRVNMAIEAVGPELAGVLIDICCFLKGLEQVEAERGWPVRSAKIVLKTALGVLHRHYHPPMKRNIAVADRMLHWGAEDYRPMISS
jgi:Domain of unknown function (DUF6456)